LKLRNKILGANKEESRMILIGSICMNYLIEPVGMVGDVIINRTWQMN
jgi:hypothetical protein